MGFPFETVFLSDGEKVQKLGLGGDSPKKEGDHWGICFQ